MSKPGSALITLIYSYYPYLPLITLMSLTWDPHQTLHLTWGSSVLEVSLPQIYF